MKILHCCLSCFYFDQYNYQENVLPRINAEDGHTVKILASTEVIIDNGSIGYREPGSYTTEYGVPITRLSYKNKLNKTITRKWRAYKNLENELKDFAPDVILFHGMAAAALTTVANYKKANPHIKLYVDCHEDKYNSATSVFSRLILYKMFYTPIVKKALPAIDKIFYLSVEAKEFIHHIYGVEENLEFYPLGGMIMDGNKKISKREKCRAELGLTDSDALLCHSGKLDKLKRTVDLLNALSLVNADNLRLMIIGSIPKETNEEITAAIENDPRVSFLGWKDSEELLEYLCACDVYVQPGSQSATMQNAICCGAPLMLYPYPSHEPFLQGNGWFVRTIDDMTKVFHEISQSPAVLADMSKNSYAIAYELLDYKKLAARLYQK